MIAFAYYLLKITMCSAILFGYYWFFLRNKVFHAYNRFYLLGIIILSIGLPLVKFNIFQEAAINKTSVVKMLQAVSAGDAYMDEIIIAPAPTTSLIDLLPFVYAIISVVLLLMLLQMLVSIFILFRKNEKMDVENIRFVNTVAARGTPFSFFNYIFWNNQIDIKSTSGNRIFKHEIAHVQERHSWDKMFINIVLIALWCNPIFWLIRKELSMIHEFIADKKAVEDGDTAAFAAMILHATYPQKNFYITNNFFYSPIKRRLMMLTKNKHPRMNYISRLLVLPLLVIVFGAFAIKITNNKSSENAVNKLTNKIVVVIDAGHGGTDNGARNKNGITEKDIALQLIKKIEALNKDENIKIILSRNEDVFSDPKQKAAFAKAQNPDLFISVHLDGNPKEKWNTVSGMLVYISKNGTANSEKSKILASTIIKSFQQNYDLDVPSIVSQRQHGIYVLQANDFPSVLIEAGYISNDKDLAYLQSEKGQEAFARNVLDAIYNYAAANSSSSSLKNELELTEKAIDQANLYSTKTPLYLSDSIRRNNESVNLLVGITKDSADIIYLLNGKKISQAEGKKILSSGKNDIQVYDKKSAYKTFGLKTKNGLINILRQSVIDSNKIIFTKVENEPEFPGGKDAWRKFLQTNINASIALKEGLKPGAYTFITQFIVDENGNLSDFSSEKNINDSIAKHCIEVIKKGPKWIPAKQNGHVVAAYRRQPITFVVAEEDDNPSKAVSTIDPIFKIGNITRSRVSVSDFINQKFVTLTDGYEFIQADVFFSGSGFSNVETAKLYGNDFTKLNPFLAKCLPGSNITFVNIKVKNLLGQRVIDERAYSLF